MRTVNAQDIVTRLDDREFLEGLIRDSLTSQTNEINQTRVAADIFVALSLRNSLTSLVAALTESTDAATRHAKRLRYATWALFAATLVLAVAAFLRLFMN